MCVCVCMCVLDNSPFQMCLFIYFLSVYDLSSYSLTLRFTKQKFLLLIKSSLSVISFIEQTFGIISKKGLSYPRSSSFSPMFSSRIFDSFAFYIEVFDPFWMNSEEVYLHSFFFLPVCECLVVPAPFVEKTIFALLQGSPTPRPWTTTSPWPVKNWGHTAGGEWQWASEWSTIYIYSCSPSLTLLYELHLLLDEQRHSIFIGAKTLLCLNHPQAILFPNSIHEKIVFYETGI